LTLEAQHERGQGGRDRTPISLVIPCKAEYVGLCRLLAGVVGARESLEAEDIADLKLVVTEACTCFLGGSEGFPGLGAACDADDPPTSLRVDMAILDETWEVTVSDPDGRYHIPGDSRCSPKGTGSLGLMIIEALVDRVEQTDSVAEGSVIRLVKRMAPRAAAEGSS
jgi:serine/threonine-protein kinase RsbW